MEAKNPYIAYIRKVVITVTMALITTLIGLLFNHLAQTLTESVTQNLFPVGLVKNLNHYEKQIHEAIVNPDKINDRLSSLGGLDEIKEDIKANVLLPLKHPQIFFSKESSILRPSRGIILHGPPGTGKTMLARAIAAEANVPFLSLGLSHLENKYFGETNKLVQGLFSLARKIQPCILFFDEIDGIMKQRNELDQSAVYGLKTELLSQIDGMGNQPDDSIFIIGTTNNLKLLDPAIKRRLPKCYEVKLPNEAERLQILILKTADENISRDLLEWVSKQSKSSSGSDLSEIVRRASAFRLQDQCEDQMFRSQLEYATCIKDLYPLMSLKKKHFEKAFSAMNVSFDDDDEHEEAPPAAPSSSVAPSSSAALTSTSQPNSPKAIASLSTSIASVSTK